MRELTIDKEFDAILGRTSAAELKQLTENLLGDGIRDPIVVWANNDDTIIDGHNRYRIAVEHDLPFKVVALKFDSRADVLAWMYHTQAGRRSTTPQQLSVLRGKIFQEEKKAAGGNLPNGKTLKGHCDPLGNTAEKVAKETGVSPSTVKRDASFIADIETLPATVKIKIASGEIKASKADAKKYAGLSSDGKAGVHVALRGGEHATLKAALVADTTPPTIPNQVSDDTADAFAFAPQFDEQRRAISKIAKWIKTAGEADSPVRRTVGPRSQQMLSDLRNVATAIKFTRPHAKCPYCKNRKPKVVNCEACGGDGWATEAICKQKDSE